MTRRLRSFYTGGTPVLLSALPNNATRYSPLATRYSLLATCYSLLATRYLLLATQVRQQSEDIHREFIAVFAEVRFFFCAVFCK